MEHSTPVGTLARGLRPRRESSSGRPPAANDIEAQTPRPSPQSQSFSQGYGSILPTSLTYILPLTRGCSPRRPDAVMSTAGRERYPQLQIFKGRRGRAGHHRTRGALPGAAPYLRLIRFQGGRAVKKEREPSPRPPSASPKLLTLPSTSTTRFGNINPTPFRCAARNAPLIQGFHIS